MTDQPTPPRGPYADIAPALDDLTQRVLFDEVWERPGLIARPTPVGRASQNGPCRQWRLTLTGLRYASNQCRDVRLTHPGIGQRSLSCALT
jgi:hypothetical protein